MGFHTTRSSAAACCVLCLGCSPPEQTMDSYLTYPATLSTFRNTVVAVGDLEAKNSHVLITPRVWPQPEIAYLAPETTWVDSGALVVRLSSAQLETNYITTLRDLEITRAEAQQKEAELNLQRFKLEADLKSARAGLAIAELQRPRLEFVTDRIRQLKSLELEKTKLRVVKLEKQTLSLVDIQNEERIHLELKIKQSETQIEKTLELLDKLELKAPVGGLVLYERNWSTGQKMSEGDGVWHGMPIAKIPDMSVMQVKLQVGETDTQNLAKGQIVEVVIAAVRDRPFMGVVSDIAKTAKPVRRDSKVKRVEVIVEMDSADVAMVPGMSARSTIITAEAFDAMVVPLECVFDSDSLKVVYERGERAFIRRPVTIERQGADHAVILTDRLEPGTMLALDEPDDRFVEKTVEEN